MYAGCAQLERQGGLHLRTQGSMRDDSDLASVFRPDLFHVFHAGLGKDFTASATVYIYIYSQGALQAEQNFRMHSTTSMRH